MKVPWPKILRGAVRIAVGAVLVAAGLLKLARPLEFHADLLAYGLPLPEAAWRFVGVIFPWVEVLGGAAFAAGFWPETVGVLVVTMALVFVGLLGQALVRGLDLHCGCFGAAGAELFGHPVAALGRAVLILVAAGWLLCPPPPYPSRDYPLGVETPRR